MAPMKTITLGKTGLTVSKNGFGALPIQRVSFSEADAILHKAFEGGINFFDTARFYTDSEEKLGKSFARMRHKVLLATKSMGATREDIEKDFTASLQQLRTDYVDLYQFHNPKTVPLPGDGTGRYELLAELKKSGAIRAIGLTNHSLELARQAVDSGLYDCIQFPFSLLSSEEEESLVQECTVNNIGFLAMKALGGGLIQNIPAAFAHMRQFAAAVPLWGIQKMTELEEFLALESTPPAWDANMREAVATEKAALGKSFCRGCGYCLPCPVDIEIPNVARMSLLLRRSPWEQYARGGWAEKMHMAENCIQCGVCAERCPYGLDTPELVHANIEDYKQFMQDKGVIPGIL